MSVAVLPQPVVVRTLLEVVWLKGVLKMQLVSQCLFPTTLSLCLLSAGQVTCAQCDRQLLSSSPAKTETKEYPVYVLTSPVKVPKGSMFLPDQSQEK